MFAPILVGFLGIPLEEIPGHSSPPSPGLPRSSPTLPRGSSPDPRSIRRTIEPFCSHLTGDNPERGRNVPQTS